MGFAYGTKQYLIGALCKLYAAGAAAVVGVFFELELIKGPRDGW